jgi:hypothetical protein
VRRLDAALSADGAQLNDPANNWITIKNKFTSRGLDARAIFLRAGSYLECAGLDGALDLL